MSRENTLTLMLRAPLAALARVWQDHATKRHLRLSIERLRSMSDHLLDDAGLTNYSVMDEDFDRPVDAPSPVLTTASIHPIGARAALSMEQAAIPNDLRVA
jgi:uncharacterized protein YjiS (DUF1127 family)